MTDTNGIPANTPTAPLAPDTLVEVKIDRQVLKEPLSKVVASYQTQSAAERRLQEANNLLQSRKAQVEFAERFQASAERNPEAALEELRSMLEMRLGRPIRRSEVSAAAQELDGLPAEQNASTRALEAKIRAVEQRLAQSEQTRALDDTRAKVQREVNQYPALKKMGETAEVMLAGMLAARPQESVSDLASELHSGIQKLLVGETQQEVTQLANRAATLAGVPSSVGTPGLTEQPAPPTVADMKKGNLREAIKNDFKSWMAKQAAAR